MADFESLKKTPLFDTHVKLGGKVVDFSGWALPVQYSSILEEHRAVRERCGLFDVSHMGEIFVRGKGAFDYLQMLLTNDIATMTPGRCRYSMLCYEDGGVVDDILVYKNGEEDYMLVVNASNTEKDFEWCLSHAPQGLCVENRSKEIAQLALQGPRFLEVLQAAGVTAVPEKNYTFVPQGEVAGVRCLISRTGYTGEDGVELYCAAEDAALLHEKLMEAGKAVGLLPCGLGARDTLRFEASMPLYGHEMDATISPLETGIGFCVKMDKQDFIGKAALQAAPPRRARIGLRLTDRGIAREHARVFLAGQDVGYVTSGSVAPTLGGNYAMALVGAGAKDGEEYTILVREKHLAAQRVELPFYKRAK